MFDVGMFDNGLSICLFFAFGSSGTPTPTTFDLYLSNFLHIFSNTCYNEKGGINEKNNC